MSNISSIIRNKAINTSHLSLSLNINNPYRSFYNLPIVSTFAKRDFPISILIPSFDNEEVNYLNSISFLAYINLTSSKIVLSRSGMVDCTFTKVSGNNSLYSCKTTGETLVVEGSNIKYIDDNKVSYYFSNNTGVSFINKIEFKDGYKLFVDIDKGVVTLSSAKLSDNNDLIYKAVLDCSKKEELKGSVYKELKGVRTLLSNIEIINRNIKIDCLISRYYDPEIGRFISPDSVEYIEPSSISGLNLYVYCCNDPINKYDPTGHFAITLTTLLIGGLIAGAIGAGIGLGTAVYKDVKEDGVWFNGDWTDYVGRTLGGFVAGFGVGICTVLGAGVGAAALGGTTATLFTSTGLTLSLGSALGIGSGVAFATGMAGYAVRTGISRSEDFKVQNMFIEGGFNAVSGVLSVLGGYLGGMAGVHNTVFTKLLSQKGDFWLRLLVENVFTAGFKLTNALIKPYFMI